jgi:hypothetical protein
LAGACLFTADFLVPHQDVRVYPVLHPVKGIVAKTKVGPIDGIRLESPLSAFHAQCTGNRGACFIF